MVLLYECVHTYVRRRHGNAAYYYRSGVEWVGCGGVRTRTGVRSGGVVRNNEEECERGCRTTWNRGTNPEVDRKNRNQFCVCSTSALQLVLYFGCALVVPRFYWYNFVFNRRCTWHGHET